MDDDFSLLQMPSVPGLVMQVVGCYVSTLVSKCLSQDDSWALTRDPLDSTNKQTENPKKVKGVNVDHLVTGAAQDNWK